MKTGMVGLGRMGSNMVRHLLRDGHECVVFDLAPASVEELDLTAAALMKNPALAGFKGRVSDSEEGRWTIKAAIDDGVPVPVLSTALYERFSSRGEADFQNKLLSAMRFQFGGHLEEPAGKRRLEEAP